ncbi:rCG52674, partial [Rattus norvegicus]
MLEIGPLGPSTINVFSRTSNAIMLSPESIGSSCFKFNKSTLL